MSKKLGIILMFVGAYVILLGGLFWNMSLPSSVKGNVYDWFWGVSAGIVVAVGAALAIKRNKLCLVGCGISLLGLAYSVGILIVGSNQEKYFSVWILVGAICVALSLVVTIIFYFREAEQIKKHGPILM